MTDPINLTENDFDFIHWEKDDGQEKETFELMIYGKSESNCNEIKQQILEHQKWYSKKHRFYEIKDELQQVIEKRNLELVHIKRKLENIQ